MKSVDEKNIISYYCITVIGLSCILLWNRSFEIDTLLRLIIFIVLCILLYRIFPSLIHSLIKYSYSLKANLGLLELSTIETTPDNKDLFILYGDEIKYYFKKSKKKFLILEDMDRFGDIRVFQRLRSLNRNLNEAGIKVRFIYTLDDGIFLSEDTNDLSKEKIRLVNENKAAEDKSKFFDYVLSMVPINNVSNATEVFENEMRKYDSLVDEKGSIRINSQVILGIGMFINDRREIINIVSDLDTFAKKLVSEDKKETFDYDKLFGAIVYKNVYPQDFNDLKYGKSKLNWIFNNETTLRNEIIKIKEYENDSEKNSNEDPNIFNDLSFAWLLHLSREELKNKENFSKVSDSIISYLENHPLLSYLLSSGLINKNISEYISTTQYFDLTFKDRKFIMNILAQKIITEDQAVDNPQKVIQYLNLAEANYGLVFSSMILEVLLNEYGDYSPENFDTKDNLSNLIKGLKRRKSFKLIDTVITNLNPVIDNNQILLLIAELGENWIEYFKEIVTDKDEELVNRDIVFFINFLNEHFSDSRCENIVKYLKDNKILNTSTYRDIIMDNHLNVDHLYY